MKLSQSSSSLLLDAIRKAVSNYANNDEQTIVTDIHFQPNQTSGELTIFDDDDYELASTTIEEWTNYEEENFYTDCERILTNILTSMKNDDAFDGLSILKPYSFVLVDDERETITELLLMDDDTLLVNDELLKGLDQELDDFLNDLLKE